MNMPSLAEINLLWQAFSWLRPAWLWLLLPLIVFAWWHLRALKTTQGWQVLIAPELLAAMRQNDQRNLRASGPRWPLLALAFSLAVLSLAGPSFSRQELNTLKLTDAVVIALDLSPSMLAEDIKPSRLQAAHFKILDLLAQRKEGYTALIAYSGSAHVVAPLSDDANTLAALVSSLTPTIMPSLGSRAEDAIDEAITLLNNAQFTGGRIILFTDGVVPEAAAHIVRTLREHPEFQLYVVAVGTEQGAPVPLNNGQFARDNAGNVVMNPLPWHELQTLAQQSGGESFHLQQNPAAIDALADASIKHTGNDTSDTLVDLPQDHGYLLLPLIALLAALAFIQPSYLLRSLALAAAVLLCQPHNSWASGAQTTAPSEAVASSNASQTWRDLWLTPDQQASRALQAQDAEGAYQRFEDPQWKAMAAYQTGRFEEAEQLFSQDSSAQGIYNTANAQAQLGKLAAAIENYQRALELDPQLRDAQANKALLEALLKQQQDQQQQQQSDQQGQGADDQQGQQSEQDAQQNAQQDGQQSSDGAEQNGEQQNNSENTGSENSDSENSASTGSDSENQDGSEQNDHSSSEETSGSPEDGAADDAQSNATENAAENAKNDEQQRAEDAKRMTERAAAAAEQQHSSDQNSAASNSGQAEPGANSAANDQALVQQNAQQAPSEEQQAPSEEQQALEQQLRRVPDDPSGLLRNKFNYYYQLDRRSRQHDGRQQEQPRW